MPSSSEGFSIPSQEEFYSEILPFALLPLEICSSQRPVVQRIEPGRSCCDLGFLMDKTGSIIEALNKYDLLHFFVSWSHDSTFPTYSNWKWIVKTKVRDFEDNAWAYFCIQNVKGKNHKNVACKNSIVYKNLPIFRTNKP